MARAIREGVQEHSTKRARTKTQEINKERTQNAKNQSRHRKSKKTQEMKENARAERTQAIISRKTQEIKKNARYVTGDAFCFLQIAKRPKTQDMNKVSKSHGILHVFMCACVHPCVCVCVCVSVCINVFESKRDYVSA
jgi:uncharacterized Rmd1/YagE family protein